MKIIERNPYSLIHITSKRNLESIINDKKINLSIHNPSVGRLQWLGNGIYFWSANDEMAIKQGKNLVKGRYKRGECVGIRVDVAIDPNKHINLENSFWYNSFMKFIRTILSIEEYDEISSHINLIRNDIKVNTDDLNKIGAVVGNIMNLFIDHLNSKRQEIDLVSANFFHGNNAFTLFKSSEKRIRQFCVKNSDLVNNSMDTWTIVQHIK